MENEPIKSKTYREKSEYQFPLSALQARHLTEENAITFEKISSSIRGLANSGSSYTTLMGLEISMDVVAELIKAGYSVSKFTNPFGENITKISW